MFNRNNFDRNPFDRSNTFDSVEARLRGESSLSVGLMVQIFLEPFKLLSSANLQTSAVIRRMLKSEIISTGDISADNSIRLQIGMDANISGDGSLANYVAVMIPISIFFNGQGNFDILETKINQFIYAPLNGTGRMNVEMALRQSINANFIGSSEMGINYLLKMFLYILSTIIGFGELLPKHIGALNSDSLELENINLDPGNSVTIDTDEFNVFVNNILDVDSVSSNSVFFNLQPGENEILITTSETNPNLDVTIIFQNRWL